MVRVCVVCQEGAGGQVTVFPFPRTDQHRHAWLTALHPLNLISDESWVPGSQHGVCDRHFLARDVRRGARTTLTRRAIPIIHPDPPLPDMEPSLSQPISLASVVSDGTKEHFIEGGSKAIRWAVVGDQEHDSDNCLDVDIDEYLAQNDSYIESQECIQESKVVMEVGEEVGADELACLVCGKGSESLDLMCVLGASAMSSYASLGVLLTKIVGRPKGEVVCVSAVMCSRCRGLVQEVAHMEDTLKTKKQDIKDMFETTFLNQRDKSKLMADSSSIYSRSSDVYPEAECNTLYVNFESGVAESKGEISNRKDNRKTSRRQASAKKYCCPHCKEEYSSLALWVHHLSKHSEVEYPSTQNKPKVVAPKAKKKARSVGHTCKECGKTFACKQSLVSHASSHQQGSDCTVCGRYLTTTARLKAHLFKFHGIGEEREKDVKCQDCGKMFGTKAGLRYHRNVVHHVGRKYICQHCKKVFHYHVPFRSHMIFNHGEKKIVCETCGEKFFTISKLNTHINAVHRGAQTWTCDKCQVKFTTQTAYRHHMNIKHLCVHHTCDYCHSQFRKKSSLLLHLWKHSVYICHLCRQNFSCGDDLRTHMSVTHGKQINMKGRRKQSAQNLHNKKLVVAQEVVIQKAPMPDQHIQTSEHVSSIVINDLLMTAESYDNTSLPSFSLATCEKLPEKDTCTFSNDDDIKVKTLSIMDTSQQLPGVDSGPFSTVETLEVKSDHIEIQTQHIEMASNHIKIPSEHIEMTSDHIEMPPEHIEMSSTHIEMPSEHIELASDHMNVEAEHIEIGSEHIEMGAGVSLINVQILGEMDMPQGTEDTLGSEDMLADAAHHLSIPPLDPHLTSDELEAPVHTLKTTGSGHALVVTGHALEAEGLEVSTHALVASGHSLEVSGPVLEASNHTLDSPTHALEVSDHALDAPCHTLVEASSHSLDASCHTLETTGHSLDPSCHTLEVAGHSLKATCDTLEPSDHTLEVSCHTLEAPCHTLEVSGHTIEVPGHSLQVTGHSLEVTGHSLEVSGHSLEVPSHSLEVTGHSLEVPSHSLEVPGHSLEVPSHSLEVTGHSLEVTGHSLEVTGHSLEVPSHSLEVQDSTLEVSCRTLEASSHTYEHLEPTSDPHQPLPSPTTVLPGPLPPILTQKEGVLGSGGEGSSGGGELGDKVELQPFSMTLDGKGEVKYQYVMYISAPSEDSNTG